MLRERGQIQEKSIKVTIEKTAGKLRAKLVLDLANLQGTDCEPFWRSQKLSKSESDSDLLQLRDELREVLSSDPLGTIKVSGILNRWTRWKPSDSDAQGPPHFVVNAQWRSIHVNPANLRVSLAFAIMELHGKIARCANPDCPSPYFFKQKKRYRFCDRPECQAFGQRELKREWWRKHGKEWLSSRKKGSTKRERTQRGKQR